MKFWFSSQKHSLKWFYNTLNSGISFFYSILRTPISIKIWTDNTSSPSSKCCKTWFDNLFDFKTKISPSQEPNEQFQQKNVAKKLFFWDIMFPLGDVTYPQIDQNAVSWKSAKKWPNFHKSTISSKMVVRGWYMTLFDHRDLLNSENRFGVVSPTYPVSPGRFTIFLDFF